MGHSEPPPKPPKVQPSFKCKLLNPKGTVLANCPSRFAAIKSATAMYGPLKLGRAQGVWELYDVRGVLVAIVK